MAPKTLADFAPLVSQFFSRNGRGETGRLKNLYTAARRAGRIYMQIVHTVCHTPPPRGRGDEVLCHSGEEEEGLRGKEGEATRARAVKFICLAWNYVVQRVDNRRGVRPLSF